jgi:Ras-related protein Rab-8A
LNAAQGILLVYDITNEKSFENILTWMRTVEANSAPDVLRMIVANKCDMTDARHVSRDRGQAVRARMFCECRRVHIY